MFIKEQINRLRQKVNINLNILFEYLMFSVVAKGWGRALFVILEVDSAHMDPTCEL